MENYKLGDAIEKMNPGDQVHGYGNKFVMSENGALYYSGDRERGSLAVLMKMDFKRDGWVIIPAKKEMVSHAEWFKKQAEFEELNEGNSDHAAADCWTKMGWQASEQNRDILYADLMKYIGMFLSELPEDLAVPDLVAYRKLIRAEVLKIIEAIKPLVSVTTSPG